MAHCKEDNGEYIDKQCRLYVKNFGDSLNDRKLSRLFSNFGNVRSAWVQKTPQGQSLGFGFVTFTHPEESSAAIQHLNGYSLKGHELFVDYHQTRAERSIVLASHHILEDTNLIVQNLHKSIDDPALKSLFSPFGTITSAKVMTKNHESLGFGFVCYNNSESAQKAIEGMNDQIFCGEKLTVKVHVKKASQKGTNLFVSNLDPKVNDQILHDEFSKYGNIVSAKVMKTKKGVSKNYGYVCYSSVENAESAIEHMDLKLLGNLCISVTFDGEKRDRHKSRSQSESSDEMFKGSKIFIKNLDPWMSEQSMKEIFSRFGTVIASEVMKTNGESLSCGFVTFASRKEAECAMWEHGDNFDITLVDDHNEMDFERKDAAKKFDDHKDYLSSDEDSINGDENIPVKKTNLYVKNLHPDVGEKELIQKFSAFGTIDRVKVERTSNGQSKKFGFVNFTTNEAASLAIEKMHNSLMKGNALYVAFHQTKEERNSFLQQRLVQRMQDLAQKNEESNAFSQKQRAASQGRQCAYNREPRGRNTAAPPRSSSQTPMTRSRPQSRPQAVGPKTVVAIPNEEKNGARFASDPHGYPRYLISANNLEKRRKEKSSTSFKAAAIDNDNHGDQMKSEGRTELLSKTRPDSSKVSVEQRLFNQFEQDEHQTAQVCAHHASSLTTGLNKPTPGYKMTMPKVRKSLLQQESKKMQPVMLGFQDNGLQMAKEASATQNRRTSRVSHEEVMRTVNAFLKMSDKQVLQHIQTQSNHRGSNETEKQE